MRSFWALIAVGLVLDELQCNDNPSKTSKMETEAVAATPHYNTERTSTRGYETSMNKGVSEISLCSAYYSPEPLGMEQKRKI